jgi:hypothetical protein
MGQERESVFTDNIHICQDWSHITSEFDSLLRPIPNQDEGTLVRQGWIFRGHKRADYPLKPSIERAHLYTDWDWAEHKILQEFQSKAALHMDPRQLPPTTPEHKLNWLAIMQHYGAPTRLLDFTYSPYVALYFALRNREENESEYAEVWGIDTDALMGRAYQVSREADEKEKACESAGNTQTPVGPVNFGQLEFYASSLQTAQREEEHLENLVRNALSPRRDNIRREHYNRNGFVAVAFPPTQNPRLASQQGVFLFNGAESRSFRESLELMMKDIGDGWYKRFRVPADQLSKIEERLFQFNIHDLSLFPDTEGLAGFVKQKLRLRVQ